MSATVASGAACACMQGWRGESEALMARAQVPDRWHEFCVYSSIRWLHMLRVLMACTSADVVLGTLPGCTQVLDEQV